MLTLCPSFLKIPAQRRAVILLPLLKRSGAGVTSCIFTSVDYLDIQAFVSAANAISVQGFGNCTAEPFDTLRVSGSLPLMVSLSNHVNSASLW